MGQSAAPAAQNRFRGPQGLLKGKTPVSVDEMLPWLERYPNRSAAEQLRIGFLYGFLIPFVPSASPQLANNLQSSALYPYALRDKVSKAVNLGRIEGIRGIPPFSNLRISPLGVVPKKDSGKFRLIHHLSYPKG